MGKILQQSQVRSEGFPQICEIVRDFFIFRLPVFLQIQLDIVNGRNYFATIAWERRRKAFNKSVFCWCNIPPEMHVYFICPKDHLICPFYTEAEEEKMA